MLSTTAQVAGLVAVVSVPAAVVALTPLAPAVALLFVGVVPAFLALPHGRRAAVVGVIATSALVGAVELVKPWPLAAAALMVLVGVVVGATAARGWQNTAAISAGWPATLLIAAPFRVEGLAWLADGPWPVLAPIGLSLLGGAWTILIGSLFLTGVPASPLEALDGRTAARYGAGLAFLLGLAAYLTATWFPGTMAGWVLLTILVTVRPGASETKRRLLARSAGTIAGGTAAALLALVLPIPMILVLAGLVAMIVSIAFQLRGVHYAWYVTVLTAAVVLLNARGENVLPVELQRVGSTALGAVLIVALILVAETALRARPFRLNHRRPDIRRQ